LCQLMAHRTPTSPEVGVSAFFFDFRSWALLNEKYPSFYLPYLLELCRSLRREPMPAEQKLWTVLRSRQRGS